MKILVKFPTRSRPLQFLKVLGLLQKAEGVKYLVTTDNVDPTMAHFEQEGVLVDRGVSHSKIHACNRGLEKIKDWDVVVLISDDMIPQLENWDKVIKRDMIKNFPDTDGCLWYNDGYQDRICTLCIVGRKYYDRFSYIYNPEYHSLFCDNEFTEVARSLGKIKYFDRVLFKHEHFANTSATKRDSLYDRNEALFNIDKQTFERRKENSYV